MSKKSKRKSEPSWALALVAIAAPVLAAGITPLFAENTVSEPYVQQSGFMGQSLFNAREFLSTRRARNDLLTNRSDTSPAISPSSAASVNPCNPAAPSTPPAATSSVDTLTLDDLTSTQRATLTRQLRHSACPSGVDLAYEQLCRRLLKEQGSPETRTGLKNPGQ